MTARKRSGFVDGAGAVGEQEVGDLWSDDGRASADELGDGVESGIGDPDVSGAVNSDADSEIEAGGVAGGG